MAAVERAAAAEETWASEEMELFRAFEAAGRERRAAILASLEKTPQLVQAGLFDHRAIRSAAARGVHLDELKELFASGPAQAGASAVERTDQTALVLVPNGRW